MSPATNADGKLEAMGQILAWHLGQVVEQTTKAYGLEVSPSEGARVSGPRTVPPRRDADDPDPRALARGEVSTATVATTLETWSDALQGLLQERQATHALAANGNMSVLEYRRRLRTLDAREQALYTLRQGWN